MSDELKSWRCSCTCATPLPHRELVVEAIDWARAKDAFYAANSVPPDGSLGGQVHITEVTE